MGSGSSGGQGYHDVSALSHYLKGTNFLAQKEEVAANTEGNDAPQDLVSQIRSADTESFGSPEEVMQALQSPLTPPTLCRTAVADGGWLRAERRTGAP